jgi:hypothetical protein
MGLVGFVIAIPPLANDIKWRAAQDSRNAQQLQEVTSVSYFNPPNSYALNSITGIFETSGISDLAHSTALKALEFNPNSYDSWRNLYNLKSSTELEKVKALKNMQRLDPLNPLIRGLK